jgi:hypothetical protein
MGMERRGDYVRSGNEYHVKCSCFEIANTVTPSCDQPEDDAASHSS